jgi:hypothetical protein
LRCSVPIYEYGPGHCSEETHSRLDAAVVEDGPLEPRDEEVCALAGGLTPCEYLEISTAHKQRTSLLTPEKRSNITALNPPGTSYKLALTAAAPTRAAGTRLALELGPEDWQDDSRIFWNSAADIVVTQTKCTVQNVDDAAEPTKQATTRLGGIGRLPHLPLMGVSPSETINSLLHPNDIYGLHYWSSKGASPFFSPSIRAEWLPNCIARFLRQLASTRPSLRTTNRSRVLSPAPTSSRGSSLWWTGSLAKKLTTSRERKG